MTRPHFNPHQVRLVRLEQTLVSTAPTGARYEYVVALEVPEARGPGFAVKSLTIHAEGFGMEPMTQNELLRTFANAISVALSREREGTRPGTP